MTKQKQTAKIFRVALQTMPVPSSNVILTLPGSKEKGGEMYGM